MIAFNGKQFEVYYKGQCIGVVSTYLMALTILNQAKVA